MTSQIKNIEDEGMKEKSKTGIKVFLVHGQFVEETGSYSVLRSRQMDVISIQESILYHRA